MTSDGEAIKVVRGRLCDALDRIERDLPRLSTHDLIRRIDALRREARPYGMAPLDQLARACGEALGRAGRGAMVRPYLASMRDAVGCGEAGAATVDAYLAAVAVRLVG